MKKTKLNLKEFKTSALEVDQLYTVRGGIRSVIDDIDGGGCKSGTTRCTTKTAGSDGDSKRCDTDSCS